MKTNKNSLTHYTYNPVKRDFLKSKGISYIVEGIHKITNNKFWVYLKCDELNQALQQWRKLQEEKFNKIS